MAGVGKGLQGCGASMMGCGCLIMLLPLLAAVVGIAVMFLMSAGAQH